MSDSNSAPTGPPMETSAVFFERLDTLIEVTTIQGWIALSALFALCAARSSSPSFIECPRRSSVKASC